MNEDGNTTITAQLTFACPQCQTLIPVHNDTTMSDLYKAVKTHTCTPPSPPKVTLLEYRQ